MSADLPIPDYDHVPFGDLSGRIRSLGEADLARLEEYEKAHAQRLLVINLLEARRRDVASGAPLSSGDAAAVPPVPAPAGGSPVSPVTSGPPMNPPSQGDPTNPAQPRG
jgi:hypothetical protein